MLIEKAVSMIRMRAVRDKTKAREKEGRDKRKSRKAAAERIRKGVSRVRKRTVGPIRR